MIGLPECTIFGDIFSARQHRAYA